MYFTFNKLKVKTRRHYETSIQGLGNKYIALKIAVKNIYNLLCLCNKIQSCHLVNIYIYIYNSSF